MQKDHKFFDDLARMASSAGGTLLEMKRDMETGFNQQVEKLLRKMDLVSREEFKVVKEMAAKARSEQERLEKRVADLEAKLGGNKPARAPKKKPAAGSAKRAGTTRQPK